MTSLARITHVLHEHDLIRWKRYVTGLSFFAKTGPLGGIGR